ncbi:hypothetical protein CGMCC3_g16779 [Colletotrichum fructicola]|nr:uncharacterized protein CGMCC3_g16779 [Colletotrichum fructicola]KAE9567061.1 hypothetical protein CGMCC3_g16779 [Colletotrichum fructicola]KAF4418554.1 hypothetical protein CFRS1_v015623 [Colletotrichum fructicola]
MARLSGKKWYMPSAAAMEALGVRSLGRRRKGAPAAARIPEQAPSQALAPDTSIATDADEKWELVDILDHDIDPDDPTRIILKCRWKVAENDTSWEPEWLIQEDAPLLWKEYIATCDHRAVLAPRERQTWHILAVKSHTFTRGKKKATMTVTWVGSPDESVVSEAFVKQNNPALLEEYWGSIGGRK